MKSQTFGKKIKELRLDLGLTLKSTGEAIDYSPRLLSKIEKNKKKAPTILVKKLSTLYKTPYKELIVKYLSEKIYYQLKSTEYANEILDTVKKRVKKEGKGTQVEQSRALIFESIRTYFSDKPVEKEWVFGSMARNTKVSKDSDIDIMVAFKKPNKISLFDLIQMKEGLSNKTGRTIDLVEEGQELKSFRAQIEKERLLVYGNFQ